MIITIIIAIMIMMIRIKQIIVVVIKINSQFQLSDFSTRLTTDMSGYDLKKQWKLSEIHA